MLLQHGANLSLKDEQHRTGEYYKQCTNLCYYVVFAAFDLAETAEVRKLLRAETNSINYVNV